jgi:hypothetical protein
LAKIVWSRKVRIQITSVQHVKNSPTMCDTTYTTIDYLFFVNL